MLRCDWDLNPEDFGESLKDYKSFAIPDYAITPFIFMYYYVAGINNGKERLEGNGIRLYDFICFYGF